MPRHRIAREDLKPVLAGFARFAEVQAGFMDALAEA